MFFLVLWIIMVLQYDVEEGNMIYGNNMMLMDVYSYEILAYVNPLVRKGWSMG